jgi:hypothetical protein
VGLERGPLSLVSTIEELLLRKSSGSSLESRGYGLGIRRADYATPLYLQEVGTNFADKRRSSDDIVRFRTKATELLLQ